ncbi:hypothetical protein ACKLNO_05975 [Neisseriaceae bacterium B1]
MPHILLDLAKLKKNKNIPYKHAKVGLLVTLKQAKKLITPDEPHAVYVLPEKKAANSIVQAALDILNAHPDSRVAVVSPRAKVQAAIADIQTQFPDAQIALFNKTGKKLKSFLKQKDSQQTENKQQNSEANDEAEEQFAKQGIARSKENAAVFTLLEEKTQKNQEQAEESDQEIQAALMLFKKNRPKKKTDLVRLLSDTQRSDEEQVHDLVVKLQEEGHIHIDAAENVRYDVA